MLNRQKLFHELHAATATLFNERAQQFTQVQAQWEESVRSLSVDACHNIGWYGALGDTYTLALYEEPYHVGAVDGSQIYPDKHQGIGCYVINIGTVLFSYGTVKSEVMFHSEPHLRMLCKNELLGPQVREVVDRERSLYEMRYGVTLSDAFTDKQHALLLIDGPLHMPEAEISQNADFFLQQLAYMEQLYRKEVLFAGYISLPKYHDISLLGAKEGKKGSEHSSVLLINDSDLMGSVVPAGARTAVFYYKKPADEHGVWYPRHLVPHFMYINNGAEIVRLEVPAFIAYDPEKLEQVCAMVMDQAHKGGGYPIVLALAHEHAVIKEADRAAFYDMLRAVTGVAGETYQVSQKSMRKKRLYI